jgi:spoIIIJ-associated protein
MNDKFLTIKELTEKLLAIMGFEAQVDILEKTDGLIVNINCLEGGLLIGQGGESLAGLNQLLKLMASKKLKDEFIGFSVDVNNYQQQKIESLKDFAVEKANRAEREGKACPLSPMSSYERRIVHLALQDRKDVVCESEGEGMGRHIVIKPV